jgi:hypothetical protein
VNLTDLIDGIGIAELRVMSKLSIAGFFILFSGFCTHDRAFGDLFRTFNKSPLHIMTCELLLKSPLDQETTDRSVLNPLRDVIYRISDITKTSIPSTSHSKNLNYTGSIESMTGEQALKVLERLNAIHDDVLNPGVDGQMVAFEIRGAEKISQALDKVEAREAELEALYKKAKLKTAMNFSSFYTWFLYSKWAMINFLIVPSVFPQDPLLATSIAAVFNTVISPLYYFRYIYQTKRVDSSFPSFKHFLRSMVAEPRPEQFAMTSVSMTLPSNFHKYLFSDQPLLDGADARNQAVNLWGGSFIKFAKEWSVKGAELKTLLKETTLNAGDGSRSVHVDRIAYYDEDTKEPVWLFIYRSTRNTPAGRKRSPPRSSVQTELELEPVMIPVRAR